MKTNEFIFKKKKNKIKCLSNKKKNHQICWFQKKNKKIYQTDSVIQLTILIKCIIDIYAITVLCSMFIFFFLLCRNGI